MRLPDLSSRPCRAPPGRSPTASPCKPPAITPPETYGGGIDLHRVDLSPHPSEVGSLTALVAGRPSPDIDAALRLAQELAALGALPGDGSTVDQWEALATVAAGDLGAVRAIEPHLDAVAILRQAGAAVPGGALGVFAAEGGDDPLLASPGDDGWLLTGTKPWCSLADRLDAALVTAADGAGSRMLFLVDLRDDRAQPIAGTWVARGLTEIPSGPVRFDGIPAVPVGEPGWYLGRTGFAWGGIGVAACWYGGAVGIARSIHAAAAGKPNPHLLAHLGAVDELLQSARAALFEAAQTVDAQTVDAQSPDAGTGDPRLLAKRTRATVARTTEEVIARAGHALGPVPLALDAAHAKRVADLTLYVRQHHAERDQESLGESLASGAAPW